MADDLILNGVSVGGGATVAADLIGGALHQRVKISAGVDGSATDVSTDDPLPVTPPKTATTAITRVNALGTSAVILASNADRLGASIYNDSDAIAYVTCNTTTTTSLFTLRMLPHTGPYELPFDYTGDVSALWASVTGAAVITEFTT